MTDDSNHDIQKELIAIIHQLLIESGEPFKRSIKPDMSLHQHLGIDSLGRAELFQRIEKHFGITIPDKLLAEAETVNDIIVFLQNANPTLSQAASYKHFTAHHERSPVDPSHAKTLIDVLLLYAEKSPQKAHIFFQNESGQEEIITYEILLNHSLRIAARLQELGLKEGETVAIMQPTSPLFFYTFFGVLLAGGIPVPIYPPFRMHMLEAYAKMEARILSNASVRILVTFEQAESLSHLLKAFVPSLKHVVTAHELMTTETLAKPFKATADHYAFIQYTSGSTAAPKGVVLAHTNLLANIHAYGKAAKITPDDIAVSWLPLYHDMGLIGMWFGSLYYGIPLVLLTPFTFLNHPERWLWAIHYHRGTLSAAPNFAYELCIRKINPTAIEGLDLSSWRLAANGAEKVYPHTLEEFAKKFEPYGFKRNALLPVYGLAESTVALAIPPVGRGFIIDKIARQPFEEYHQAIPAVDEDHPLEFVACGLPMPNHEIRIIDDQNNELPDRHVGNLQFRGPSSMQGYYNNPEATQAIYHDGWWDSGDLAYMAEGEVYITGRRKDLIVKAGRNLYPAEIEEIVGNIKGVRQGCVTAFGIHDTQRGTEQLIIVAETQEKNTTKREQIVADINEAISVALDIVPDHVCLVAPHMVPKTSSGKLQRAACHSLYVSGKLSKQPLPAWIQIFKLGAQGLLRNAVKLVKAILKSIYTVYTAILFILAFFFLFLLFPFLSRDGAAKVSQVFTRWLLLLTFCPVKVINKSFLYQTSPVIFVSNHASYMDALIMQSLLPTNTRFVAKKELFDVPILGKMMRKLGHIRIDRIDSPRSLEDTKAIAEALKEGHSVLMFPEGTFGYSPGLRPFRLGAFKMAVDTQTPICPLALQGTRVLLRDTEILLRPGYIKLTACEPISPQGHEWQDVTQLRTTVRTEIAKYCGEPSLDFIVAQKVATL